MNISIIGARTHNLKNISVSIPRNKLVVFTGVSGSGKSSLVFDTIYAEAQRQFLESLSSYARKSLQKFSSPPVEHIDGISPAIVIDQKRLGINPRSTVGTVTEIYTYLRMLYSRCGTPYLGDSTLFSFNTPEGACLVCKGLGEELLIDADKIVDWTKSLAQGAIRHSEYKIGSRRLNIMKASGLFEWEKPLNRYTKSELNTLLYAKHRVLNAQNEHGFIQHFSFEGIINTFKRRRLDKRGTAEDTVTNDTAYCTLRQCKECHGARLNKSALTVTVNGKTIVEIVALELTELSDFLDTVTGEVAAPLVARMREQLHHLTDIGVGYLSLNRAVGTLSGGESQRVKMARQLGTTLVELLYILDEPSIGLHPRDMEKLLFMLKQLRDNGNSVLVVEHDPAVIKEADHIIEIGPGAGSHGGKVIFEGTVRELQKITTATGKALQETFRVKKECRQATGHIAVQNAMLHNLQNVSVKVPCGVFACVTGVAGSGKSSLVNDVIARQHPEAVVIDQSSVARSLRSNPATYTGVFSLIRKEFAKAAGVHEGLFSFNSIGACKNCDGKGFRAIEMHFLDDVKVTCSVCQGKRYTQDVLKLHYQGKSIYEVLLMTAQEALKFFPHKEIKRRLQVLEDVGLNYLELGQSLDTLSGGEAQRIKLASELHKKGNMYILDEPTTGLHVADIATLLKLLNNIVDNGNSVIVIEHNLDVIAQADWIMDMGPEGGKKGGQVIAKGTPTVIMNAKESYTGQYLRKAIAAPKP